MPRAARALVLCALLFGPLAGAELWARNQLDLLYPYLIGSAYWPDTKQMLLDRAGCPDALALGSSVTNRTLVAQLTEDLLLPFPGGDAPADRIFSFGLNLARTTHLYGAWRRVKARGCTPRFVFVEVLPATLNGDRANRRLLRPFLDPATAWHMPRGFADEANLGWEDVVDAATIGRLHLHRLRVPVRTALLDAWGIHASDAPERPLPLDGMIRPLLRKDLLGDRYARERAERSRIAARGEYRLRESEVQVRALEQLIDEATARGARVILHSPPVTAIYHEIVDRGDSHAGFCAARERIGRRPGLEWYFAYDGEGFDAGDFMDWNHMNRGGGKRYVRRLFRAVRTATFPDTDWCRQRAS